jgi:hypothetical protein
MLGIYIRPVDSADAQHLIDVPTVADIDEVLKTLRKHGVYAGSGDRSHSFSTQFVVDDDDGAYLEIVVE